MLDHLIDTFVGFGAIAITTTIATSLDSSTQVPLGTALTVAGVITGGCWWLSSKFTRIDDSLASIEKIISSRPCIKNNEPCELVEPKTQIIQKEDSYD